MANYFDTKANKGMIDGREVYDHNEYLRLTGQQGGAGGSFSSSQSSGQSEALNKRYDALIQSIKDRGQQAVNKQTIITSNELGKRGILGSSSLAGQEIQNSTEPVRQQYVGIEAQTELDRQREINAIQQAIEQSRMAQQQYTDAQKQQAFENTFRQRQQDFDMNKSSGASGIDNTMAAAIGAIMGNIGGQSTGKPSPTPSFKPAFGPLKSGYVFADPNSKFNK